MKRARSKPRRAPKPRKALRNRHPAQLTPAELLGRMLDPLGRPLEGYRLAAFDLRSGDDDRPSVLVATVIAPTGERRVRVALVRKVGGFVRCIATVGPRATDPDPEPRRMMPQKRARGGRLDWFGGAQ